MHWIRQKEENKLICLETGVEIRIERDEYYYLTLYKEPKFIIITGFKSKDEAKIALNRIYNFLSQQAELTEDIEKFIDIEK